MKKAKVLEAVKASLKADGIAINDKARAVESLSKCCGAKICIDTYLYFFNGEINERSNRKAT